MQLQQSPLHDRLEREAPPFWVLVHQCLGKNLQVNTEEGWKCRRPKNMRWLKGLRDVLTKKLWPPTSCHSCTGSFSRYTFEQSANCSRNVVLPLPTLPSMNTVYGRLQYSSTAMSARLLENISSAVMSLQSSRPGRGDVFNGWIRWRESVRAQRSNDWQRRQHNDLIAFNRQNALYSCTVVPPTSSCCCINYCRICIAVILQPPLLSVPAHHTRDCYQFSVVSKVVITSVLIIVYLLFIAWLV